MEHGISEIEKGYTRIMSVDPCSQINKQKKTEISQKKTVNEPNLSDNSCSTAWAQNSKN